MLSINNFNYIKLNNSQGVSFGGKNSTVDEQYKYQNKDKAKDFLLYTTALVATVLGGLAYEENKMDKFLQDLNEEVANSPKEIILQDCTNDNVKDILIIAKDDVQCVYDCKNKKAYYKFDDELVEKLY